RCHSASAEKLKAGLRLDTPAGLLRGGESGPAVVPGKPDESLLIQAIRHEDDLAMPPKKAKLPEGTLNDFKTWVNLGAPDPRATDAAVSDDPRQHWAFQAVKNAVPPKVHNVDWVSNPIDAFILARLEKNQCQPAPAADRVDWIRRVSLDLIGLPPSPEEVDAF